VSRIASLSSPARRSLHAQETGEVWLALLTISHPDIADGPIRVVDNTVDVVSRGDTYVAWPFDWTLPTDAEDVFPDVALTISNVDRRVTEAIDALETPPTMTFEVVLASSPDLVEMSLEDIELRSAKTTILTISGKAVFDPALNDNYPPDLITPATFPGVFR